MRSSRKGVSNISKEKLGVSVVAEPRRPGAEGIAWVLRGHWRMADTIYQAGSGIWWQNQPPGELIPHSEDARLLLAEIERR